MTKWAATSFQIEVPEIYQLEVTNHCNLSCPACIRQDIRVKRPVGFLDLALVKKMIARGDFSGSYFVELQMYGEPLLHPQLFDIIRMVKLTGCKVGMSTNGVLLLENLPVIKELDYLTISVDSIDKTEYKYLRSGKVLAKLVSDIDTVLALSPRPIVDLQVINFWSCENQLPGLVNLAQRKQWDVTCRAVPDCFAAYQDRPYPAENLSQLCLNPYLSVSIQWDGDCLPCCFSAGKDIVYGNLHTWSLKDIWKTSPIRQYLMRNMVANYNTQNMPCSLCYMRSPALFHVRMLMENLRRV